LSFRSELADTFRLYRTAFVLPPGAGVEAEALVRHHGSEGVAIARAREVLSAGASRVERLHDWLVRLLAERSHELLCTIDVDARYDVVAEWARWRGQMIVR
jgi:hypothetical protein